MPCLRPEQMNRNGKRYVFPCGKCNYCLEANRAQWTFRLRQEEKVAQSAYFLTLTYDDQHVPVTEDGEQQLNKDHVQRFMKRLRKDHEKTGKTIWRGTKRAHRASKAPKIKYYFVGEYGTDTDRPHYHAIMFNLHSDTLGTLADIWGAGHVQIGSVTPESIHYVTKYVVNRQLSSSEERQKPFALISKGLGKSYVDTNGIWHQSKELRNYAMQDGHKIKLPRYYADKLFTEHERIDNRSQSRRNAITAQAKEIKRLSRSHKNPLVYIDERLHANHELITQRLNKKNSKNL